MASAPIHNTRCVSLFVKFRALEKTKNGGKGEKKAGIHIHLRMNFAGSASSKSPASSANVKMKLEESFFGALDGCLPPKKAINGDNHLEEQLDYSNEASLPYIPDLDFGITPFDRDLLNQVNSMDIEAISRIVPDEGTIVETSQESFDHIRDKYSNVERMIDILIKKSRAKYSLVFGSHISEQINNLAEEHLIKKEPRNPIIGKEIANQEALLKTSELESEKLESIKLEPDGLIEESQECPDGIYWPGVTKVAGELRYRGSRIWNEELDSDITASSSGNESVDEEEEDDLSNSEHGVDLEVNDTRQRWPFKPPPIPLRKRGLYRFLRMRASVGAKVSWLISQILDLEIKIYTHNDMYKKIKCSKGALQLEGIEPPLVTIEPDPASVPCSLASTIPKVPSTSAPSSSLVLNGYHHRIEVPSQVEGEEGERVCPKYDCSRTRPLDCTKFRRRSLIRIRDVYRKRKGPGVQVAPSHSVRCSCIPYDQICMLCAARGGPHHWEMPRNAGSRRQLDMPQSITHKIAEVDSAFHPALSFPSDVPGSLLLDPIFSKKRAEDLSKLSEDESGLVDTDGSGYLTEIFCGLRPTPAPCLSMDDNGPFGSGSKNKSLCGNRSVNKRKYPRNLIDGNHRNGVKKKRKKKMFKIKHEVMTDDSVEDEDTFMGNDVCYSQPGSPHGSAYSSKRKKVHSFDIDNVLIPQSGILPEKPHYKEIDIPYWRELTEAEKSTIMKFEMDENMKQDLVKPVEEIHAVLELDEKTKLKRPLAGKHYSLNSALKGARRRLDSFMESMSDANTPERSVSPSSNTGSVMDNSEFMADLTHELIKEEKWRDHNNHVHNNHNNHQRLRNGLDSEKKAKANGTEGEECIYLPNTPLSTAHNLDTPVLEAVAPYERRIFPLSPRTYDHILTETKCISEEMEFLPDYSHIPIKFSKGTILNYNYYEYDEDGTSVDGPSGSGLGGDADEEDSDSAESLIDDQADPDWVEKARKAAAASNGSEISRPVL